MSIGIGDALRQAREEQGRTVEEAARVTRVRGDYLRALEDEDFGVFGGDVYAKGFLASYARYLNLDPQPLLDTYKRYVQHDDFAPRELVGTPAASPGREAPPSWVAWLVVAVLVVVGTVAVGSVLGSRTPDPAGDEPTGAAGAPQPVDTGSSPAVADPGPPTTSPTPTPTFDGVEVLLAFEEDCWVQVEVDGQQLETGTIPAGESRTYQGSERVTITYGNAGGVRVQVNGQDLGSPGGRGEVTQAEYTPSGTSDPSEA